MEIQLTQRGAIEYGRIRSGDMTPTTAALYLQEGNILTSENVYQA